MTAYESRQILIALKRQIRDRKAYEAVDKAIQALIWLELEEKKSLDDEDLESGVDNEDNI